MSFLYVYFFFSALKLCSDFIFLQDGCHQEVNDSKCWSECEGKGTYIYSCWECKLVVTMEISVEISQQPRNNTTVCPSYITLGYTFKEKYFLQQKYWLIHVYWHTIINSLKMKSTLISITYECMIRMYTQWNFMKP